MMMMLRKLVPPSAPTFNDHAVLGLPETSKEYFLEAATRQRGISLLLLEDVLKQLAVLQKDYDNLAKTMQLCQRQIDVKDREMKQQTVLPLMHFFDFGDAMVQWGNNSQTEVLPQMLDSIGKNESKKERDEKSGSIGVESSKSAASNRTVGQLQGGVEANRKRKQSQEEEEEEKEETAAADQLSHHSGGVSGGKSKTKRKKRKRRKKRKKKGSSNSHNMTMQHKQV